MNAAPPANPQREVRQRLAALLGLLEAGLIERGRVVRLAFLAALAGEHTLLVGPPGTAKSELARRLHLAFGDTPYFERLLTRFSVPEELFGPLSIAALEQDRYERQTAGFLPEAGIAFIDEVFKANSAILNALLTLLNEREFDNGAHRVHCPLIACIGATNEVPEDEVASAFLDRFLLRLSLAPVSDAGFLRLLEQGEQTAASPHQALDRADLAALAQTAATVRVPPEVVAILAELRAHLQREGLYVSDRRWVKLLHLLRVQAASDGRAAVSPWDLWLVPLCAAARPEQQADIDAWLTTRLGVDKPYAPERLTRVLEAFEAQLKIESSAEDLNYDESGKLVFGEIANDAKGGGGAMRMSFRSRRHYGATHIGARLAQLDEARALLDQALAQAEAAHRELQQLASAHLWMDETFAASARTHLEATRDAVVALQVQAETVRAGFEALPRLASDDHKLPAPVALEPSTVST